MLLAIVSPTCTWEKGHNYIGTVAITATGKRCQRWDSQTPHEHPFVEMWRYPGHNSLSSVQNYCRNPDWVDAPWCYTTSYLKRWEYCNIPTCPEGESSKCFLSLNNFPDMDTIYERKL